jgi:hypothetical protein
VADDPLEAYLAAKAQLDDTAHRLAEIGQLIHAVGQALMRSPPNLVVNDANFPAELLLAGRVVTLSPERWPTIESLRSALCGYRDAEANAHELYQRLSPEACSIVNEPGTRQAKPNVVS